MLSQLTISKKTQELPLDYRQLYAIGLKHIQQLSSRIWTDYNVHDPGITSLELLCYALTDLSYRASFPIADLLASESNNAEEMKKQFFTARQILPNRPLTLLDYRKLLIDLDGVKNAWLYPASQIYYADIVNGELLHENPDRSGIVEVNLAGLYEVKIEYENEITTVAKQDVMQTVKQELQANRNLCEDFVDFIEVEPQSFQLCAELELAANADVTQVNAAIRLQVQKYLSPQVRFYTLSEMLTRQKVDGTPYTVDEIFDGPALSHGFIDDDELEKADLRTEIRLSDIISIIMDIAGVQAVRDIVINPEGNKVPIINKWVIPVDAGKKAILNTDPKVSRLVFYKRNMPVVAGTVEDAVSTIPPTTEVTNDLPVPLGIYRDLANYYSFQNHFPAIYGLSDVGLSSTADEKRKALAYQLKAYLLFFDQVMANYFAQLSHVRELFSVNPDLKQTYFYQVVNSFADYSKIYRSTFVPDDFIELASFAAKLKGHSDEVSQFFWSQFSAETQQLIVDYAEEEAQMQPLKIALANELNRIIEASSIYDPVRFALVQLTEETQKLRQKNPQREELVFLNRLLLQDAYSLEIAKWNREDKNRFDDRRNRFLDHLIARFAEKFHDLANTIYSAFSDSTETDSIIRYKCNFLSNYPTISSERALAYNYSLTNENDLWNTDNVSGLEKRLAKLLGIRNYQRRNLSAINYDIYAELDDQGMYLIENILLRPEQNTEPFLPICPTPNCTDCAEADPYSYRINIILPAYSHRFQNMDFRRFVEEVIREETPAHILPKICWIDKNNMAELEKLYRDWIYLKAGAEKADRKEKLQDFINKLSKIKNIYPKEKLHECDSSENQNKFILGRTALGTGKNSLREI